MTAEHKDRRVLLVLVAAGMSVLLGGLAIGAHAVGSAELALMFGGAAVTGTTGVAGAIALLARNGRHHSTPPPPIIMTREQVRALRHYSDDFRDSETTDAFATRAGISIAPPPDEPRRKR